MNALSWKPSMMRFAVRNTTRVELIYDADCPNVAAARSVLIKAFTKTGVSACWREWERSASDAPQYAKDYASPTILSEESIKSTSAFAVSFSIATPKNCSPVMAWMRAARCSFRSAKVLEIMTPW